MTFYHPLLLKLRHSHCCGQPAALYTAQDSRAVQVQRLDSGSATWPVLSRTKAAAVTLQLDSMPAQSLSTAQHWELL